MVIRTKSFKEIFSGSHSLSTKMKANFFAHAGVDYWSACEILVKNRNSGGRWHLYAELPLMHMALELMTKAIALYTNQSFDAKKYLHKTSKIIIDYSGKIELFRNLINDHKKIQAIKELEKSWEIVRYGEGGFRCDGEEWKLLCNIAEKLYDECKKLSGLRDL